MMSASARSGNYTQVRNKTACMFYGLLNHPGIQGVTLCFCTVSYAADAGGPRLCSCHNLRTTFRNYFPFSRIDDSVVYITWLDFCRFSTRPWPRSFNVKYGIWYPLAKKTSLPRNKKQAYRLNSRPPICPSGWTLAITLIWIVYVHIWNLVYHKKKVRDQKQTYRLNSGPQMWQIGFDRGHNPDREF